MEHMSRSDRVRYTIGVVAATWIVQAILLSLFTDIDSLALVSALVWFAYRLVDCVQVRVRVFLAVRKAKRAYREGLK